MDEFIKTNPKLITEPTFHENFEYEIRELMLPSLDALKKKLVWILLSNLCIVNVVESSSDERITESLCSNTKKLI